MKNNLKKTAQEIAKVLAVFYNWIPTKYRSGIYGIVSLFVTSISTLLVADLSKIHTDNAYIAAVLVSAVGLFHIFVNIVQQKLVELGTKLLAAEGNEQVVENLQVKMVETKKLIASSK